jgi:hypothetical protein
MSPRRVLDTKTYWLTGRQSQCDFDFDFDFEETIQLYPTSAEVSSHLTRDQGQLSPEQSRRHFTKISGASNCNSEEEMSDDIISWE